MGWSQHIDFVLERFFPPPRSCFMMWRRKFLSMSPALFISFNLSSAHKQFVIDQRTLFIAIVSNVCIHVPPLYAMFIDIIAGFRWNNFFNARNFSDNFWVLMVATSSSSLKHLQVVVGILMFDHRHTLAPSPTTCHPRKGSRNVVVPKVFFYMSKLRRVYLRRRLWCMNEHSFCLCETLTFQKAFQWFNPKDDQSMKGKQFWV